MPRRTEVGLDFFTKPRDLPTWTNVLITDDMPIRWITEPGEPWPGDELAGRLVFGQEEQLVIDLCGTAVTKLLAVLVAAHHGTDTLSLTADATPTCAEK